MALCLLGSYPLSAVLKRLPDSNRVLKDLYIVGVSMFYLLGVFNTWSGLRTLLISTLGTYFITKTLRTSPFMPWINFLFVMGHLFIGHIHAQMHEGKYDVNEIDISGAQMVLCMKLTAFAWNVYDGLASDSALTDFQRSHAIKQHPPLLDFLAYALFFPSLFTGPSCDYADFARWVDLSMFDVTKNDPKRGRAVNRRIPRSGRVAALKAAEGVAWIALWIKLSDYISTDEIESDTFLEKSSFLTKVLYMYAVGFLFRLKYYGAWSISEGACILSGLGFNGKTKTGKYRWDGLKNINPIGFEKGQNTYSCLESWNMNTNKWLKNYIYLRVTPKGKKPGFRSTLATFFTSAAWHGTRPGYYLMFLTGAFYQSLGKDFRRHIRPIFMEPDGVTPGPHKRYYDIVSWFVTQLSFGYLIQPFALLDLKPSLKVWSSVYFYIHLLIIVLVVLFHGPPKKAVLRYLKSLQPAPMKESEKIKQDTARLRAMRQEIELLPSLGIPQPDFDTIDDDMKEALQEFEDLKQDIARELQSFKERRNSVSKSK
ncbi:lysophospholipid acyltransferase [Trichomonascus vanleenenianus]|uniref:lysophospholipid acyltransferase n=1 Tax=Trichomonascus vanleenenianus TaxID=2268995 RepID=UPI003ECA03F0